MDASKSNFGFSILLKHTLAYRLEQPEMEPPTVWFIDDLLYQLSKLPNL